MIMIDTIYTILHHHYFYPIPTNQYKNIILNSTKIFIQLNFFCVLPQSVYFSSFYSRNICCNSPSPDPSEQGRIQF